MQDKQYTKTEIKEGERKKDKLLNNLSDLHNTVNEIVHDVEEAKEELLVMSSSSEKRKEYEKYISDVEHQVSKLKYHLDIESKRIDSLSLNYDDLKTEPSDPLFLTESDHISMTITITAPVISMFLEYLNYLDHNKILQEKTGIKIKYIFNEECSFDGKINTNITESSGYEKHVLINFKDTDFVFSFKKQIQDGQQVIHKISINSKERTYINRDYLYKKFLFNSVSHSSAKGKYLIMHPKSLMWEYENLEKRDFSDIFLPTGKFQDLNLYVSLFQKSGRLLRYLFVGNPGTGKTESTVAIANLLKNLGVTVIKTSVCPLLKQKVELAELLSPSILIIDDIDLSLGSRSRGMISSSLGDFLNILDGTEKLRGDVGIIATTNSLELLDLAAQRPGRFDKLIEFGEITRDNIKNIILKSLRYGFGKSEDDEMSKICTNDIIIEEFYKSRVTGSHVYNTINMLITRVDTLEIKDVTPQWFLNEIRDDIKTLEKVRSSSYLNDKVHRRSEDGGLGFTLSDEPAEVSVNDLPWDREDRAESPNITPSTADFLIGKR